MVGQKGDQVRSSCYDREHELQATVATMSSTASEEHVSA